MNCCFIIILLLLLGNCNCGSGWNNIGSNSCSNDCRDSRRDSRRDERDSDCDNNCTRTQTVITRTECDTNSRTSNMASDSYANNRYSMYNMDNDDCGCRN